MQTVFDLLASAVLRRPVVVLLVVLAVSGGLAGFAGQAVTDDSIAVDNEASEALDRAEALFGAPQTVLQVVIESTDGRDVRSADALATTLAIDQAIRSSELVATLVEGPQPAIVSYLGGTETAARMGGIDPATPDDAVVALQEAALTQAPVEIATQVERLLGEGTPPAVGLMLVF